MNNPSGIARLARLRKTQNMRDILQETRLSPEMFIAPLFINDKITSKIPIPSMPSYHQLSLNDLKEEIESLSKLHIKAVLLFGIPSHKDATGSDAISSTGIIQKAIPLIKSINPDMLVISDLCFCEYTDHGHCGILSGTQIDTNKTLTLLAEMAISHASAGADWVAPSGMTDGMVQAIRTGLDGQQYYNTAILSYAVKYASSLYGPFREAAEGAPQFGDRKSYQLNPANAQEALREAMIDVNEGADMIMVKPASLYLDIVARLKIEHPSVPLCAYQVSGEFSMIKAAAAAGYLSEEQAMLETLTAIKRAGADFIISYFAKDAAKYLLSLKG